MPATVWEEPVNASSYVWFNDSFIGARDGAVAYARIADSTTIMSFALVASNFRNNNGSIQIPPGVIITGVQVNITRSCAASSKSSVSNWS